MGFCCMLRSLGQRREPRGKLCLVISSALFAAFEVAAASNRGHSRSACGSRAKICGQTWFSLPSPCLLRLTAANFPFTLDHREPWPGKPNPCCVSATIRHLYPWFRKHQQASEPGPSETYGAITDSQRRQFWIKPASLDNPRIELGSCSVTIDSTCALFNELRPIPLIEVRFSRISLSLNTAISNQHQSCNFDRPRLANLASVRPMLRVTFNGFCIADSRPGLGFTRSAPTFNNVIAVTSRRGLAAVTTALNINRFISCELRRAQINPPRSSGVFPRFSVPMIRIILNSKPSCAVHPQNELETSRTRRNVNKFIPTKWRSELAACTAHDLNRVICNKLRLSHFDLPRSADLLLFLFKRTMLAAHFLGSTFQSHYSLPRPYRT